MCVCVHWGSIETVLANIKKKKIINMASWANEGCRVKKKKDVAWRCCVDLCLLWMGGLVGEWWHWFCWGAGPNLANAQWTLSAAIFFSMWLCVGGWMSVFKSVEFPNCVRSRTFFLKLKASSNNWSEERIAAAIHPSIPLFLSIWLAHLDRANWSWASVCMPRCCLF